MWSDYASGVCVVLHEVSSTMYVCWMIVKTVNLEKKINVKSTKQFKQIFTFAF